MIGKLFELSKGGFGKVFLVENPDGSVYALKEQEINKLSKSEFTIIQKMQASLSKNDSYLEKDSIIKFFDGKEENNKFIIDMEFCPFGHIQRDSGDMINQFVYNSIFL